MKILYPKNLEEDEQYVELLVTEYQSVFPDFNNQALTTPIAIILNDVEVLIEEFDDETLTFLNISIMRNMVQSDWKINGDGLNFHQAALHLYHFVRKTEAVLELVGIDLNSVLPQQKDRYLDFIAQAAKKIVNDVCSVNEREIPMSARLEDNKSKLSEILRNGNSGKEFKSFVDRITKNRM